MNQLLAQIKKGLLAAAVQKLSLSLSGIAAAILAGALTAQSYLVQYMPSQPEIWLVRLFAISVTLALLWIATYFWFKPKLVVSQKDGGCSLDEKTGIRYCNSCKIKYHQLAPLQQKTTKWCCTVVGCYQIYPLQAQENET